MAKPAFPEPLGNLMHFMYQLKTTFGRQCPKLCSPDSLLAQSGWAKCTSNVPDLNQPFKTCIFILLVPGPWHLITTSTNKFDHSQVNQTEQRTDLHLTDLKALVHGKIYVKLDLSFSGAAGRRTSVFPSCLFQLGGKKLQTLNAAETGTSVSLPEHNTEPLFLPTVTAKMTELQGHVFCWRPYHESFD